MESNRTEAQIKAIETLDKSVLVSAAAGAGKTTVLIERIIGIILGGHANVDEMLVVTFTNAAASEMRLRLASAIRRRMREHVEDATKMREQLSRLHRSYISTIDSFAQRVVKEFFYEIDMEPEFSMCDEVQAELMKREAAAELLEDAFETDDIIDGGSFREFMRLYSDERSDETFTTNLIKSYDSLRTMPDYFEWAYEKADQLNLGADEFKSSTLYESVLADAKEVFENACGGLRKVRGLMDDAGVSDLFERKLSDETNAINDIRQMLDDEGMDDAFFSALDNISYGTLNTKKDEKEPYEPIKEEVKAIREVYKKEINSFISRYANPDFDTCIKEMNETYRYTIYYLKLLEEFERRYSHKKSEKRLMDFSDITHAAARILKKDEAAETMRRRFKFVFVDEYQDTNNLQEYLIGKVSRPRNVFKVGDVKQSIYKFRLAEPEIFERLEREYSDPANEDGELINLSMNFRTNDATISYINHVFENVMEGYSDETKLYTGMECPPEYDFKPEVHVLLTDDDEEETIDDEIEELTNSEAESVYIAELAAGIVGTEFYDTKQRRVRKAEARDIAILLHSVKKSGDQIASALAAKSVDAHIEAADDYFDTLEINIALSLFMCIDNFKRDVPLIAALHSEIFDFTPEELATIRIAHREETDEYRVPYHEAFSWYVQSGPEGKLKEKAAAAYSQIIEWRKQSRIMPLSDFIWKVLTESGYYRAAGAMNSGSRRQANLKSLADRAAAFSKDNIASLSSFINFVEVMKSKKLSNGQPPMAGKEDNLVRISTMHKSKGLEFPFVIVGGLGRKFNRDNREKKFTFDSTIGVGMPYIDPDRKYWRSSIVQNAIKQKADSDSYKEDLRLLYVDMTRARNKLYLVGSVKDTESLMKYGKANCYLKVLKDFIKTPYNEYCIKNLPKTAEEDGSKSKKNSWNKEITLGAAAEAYYEEIDRRLKYEYPHKDKLSNKTKYSVSAIRREELKAETEENGGASESEIVVLHEISDRKKKASAADIGIAYHRIMEFIDFEKAASGGEIDSEYIRERAEFLREKNAIEDDVFKEIDLGKVETFFKSDIGKRALKASEEGRLSKEKPFTLKTERSGREILVQGVIDCCFEENGGMTLVDYKSSYIRKGGRYEEELDRIRKEYKVQLELYSEAVKKGTGLDVNAAYLYLFNSGDYIEV